MAAEYKANAPQPVNLNSPIIFNNSIPCRRGIIIHENETGLFTLRGATDRCYALYQATFAGNIALPTGATVGPIAVAIIVQGEALPTSRAIITPAAVEEYGNVTSTAIIRVPRGCCFSVAVESVSAVSDPTATPAPVITVENANLVIDRIG